MKSFYGYYEEVMEKYDEEEKENEINAEIIDFKEEPQVEIETKTKKLSVKKKESDEEQIYRLIVTSVIVWKKFSVTVTKGTT